MLHDRCSVGRAGKCALTGRVRRVGNSGGIFPGQLGGPAGRLERPARQARRLKRGICVRQTCRRLNFRRSIR